MIVYKIAKSVRSFEKLILNVYRYVLSLMKIVVLSKFNLKLPSAKTSQCIILGNGPSLKDTFKEHATTLENAELFVVNNFPTAKEFKQYKPTNYIVLDPGYFLYKERPDIKATFLVLKNEVDWAMNFFVPYMYRKDKDIIQIQKESKFITVCFYNYTLMKGPDSWIFPMFKKNLAMPQFYNVMGAAINVALNIGYKKVWLVGADHSWFDNLIVGDDNIVYRKDVHFYDKGEEDVKLSPIVEPISNTKVTMEGMFWALSAVFKSYGILENYSKYLKATIINASEFSYLDTFVRKNLNQYDK